MKNRTPHLAALLCLLFSAGGAIAASTVPIVDKAVVFDEKPSTRTPEQVRGYILYAANTFRPTQLTSRIESDTPGALQLELNKENNHYLTLLFTYDNAGFKASYAASKNLNYGEKDGVRVIHENSMIWVDEIIRKAKAAYGMQLNANGEETNPQAVSELRFRSTGARDTVTFQKTDETHSCGKFDEVGEVASWSEAEVAARAQEVRDWAAASKTMTAAERRLGPKPLPPHALTLRVVAQRPVLIKASSSVIAYEEVSSTSLTGGSLFGAPPRRERHACGPLTFKFTPQGARKYAIEYAVSYAESRQGKCTQNVFDVTEPGQRIPVAAEDVQICTAGVSASRPN